MFYRDKYLLWQQFMQQMLCLVFLNKIVLGPLLNQILQIVSVLLHLPQQAVKDQAHGVAAGIK